MDPRFVAALDQAKAFADESRPEVMMSAARLWMIYQELVDAGFTDDQAFALLLTMVEGAADE